MTETSQAQAKPPLPAPERRPELLAPAGDWDCVKAAVENGADAIYFGLDRFNARMRAKNFTAADLPALMEFLHKRGLKGYLTFNILVFETELAEAEDYLRTVISAGVDAVIVQDVGVARLIRSLSPDFPIHCSTQMTITSPAGVGFARRLGAQLVVLARENNFKDIASIRLAEAENPADALPLEAFVHGALCVAYSGQCLTSEALGGRSANRGECAQACRLPYGLVSDGLEVPLGDRKYLLSPKDLAGIDVMDQLIHHGLASLKIEGRLKSAEYVASITRVYRQAIDQAWGRTEAGAKEALNTPTAPKPAQRSNDAAYELEMAFSRGLAKGWFEGTDNQSLVHARFGTKRGVLLGRITRVGHDSVELRLEAPLKPGDGVVFDAGTPEKGEEGGRVYEVDTRGGATVLRFGRGDLDFARIASGNLLWKTSDPALERELRNTFEGDKVRHQRPVHAEVHGQAGAPLTLLLRDEEGHLAQAESSMPLEKAERQALTETRLREQLGRLGGTAFRLSRLENHLEGELSLPVSELNRLRRDCVAELDRLRALPRRWTLAEQGDTLRPLPQTRPAQTRDTSPAELIALVRSLPQLEAAWSAGVRTLYCDFEFPRRYAEAVERFRQLQAGGPGELWVAPPRVHKPGEEWILAQVRDCGADGILARNHDHLVFFAGHRLRGDFSLNVANHLTATYFISEYGLERVTASYDLNVSQLESLLPACDTERLDITLHQHMPLFHMEHCVFCAFLSTGKDYHDCGRPCEKHKVELRDRVGALLPLKADAGCRNTVFNNKAQTGAEFLPRFLALGARHFRVEFVDESPEEVRRTLGSYQQLLTGKVSGAELWRDLKLINQLGVTRGQLETQARVLNRKT